MGQDWSRQNNRTGEVRQCAAAPAATDSADGAGALVSSQFYLGRPATHRSLACRQSVVAGREAGSRCLHLFYGQEEEEANGRACSSPPLFPSNNCQTNPRRQVGQFAWKFNRKAQSFVLAGNQKPQSRNFRTNHAGFLLTEAAGFVAGQVRAKRLTMCSAATAASQEAAGATYLSAPGARGWPRFGCEARRWQLPARRILSGRADATLTVLPLS